MSAGPALPRLLAGIARQPRLTLSEHLAVHGAVPPGAAGGLVAAAAEAGLRGRGGGGFPTATKLEAVAGRRGRAVVVANGSEGEPMSGKDRLLLEAVPHLVLDGALVAAGAVGAREVLLSVPDDAARAQTSLHGALSERDDAGGVRVVGVPRRYLAGEESALVRFLDGGPLKPTVTPPRPAERGIGRRPTLVDNVETLAHLALIARHGGAWFRALGTPGHPGSALVTLSGAVARPGVYEIATGMRLADLVDAAGGQAEAPRAVLLGGFFGTWITAEQAAEQRLDATIGSGIIVVLGRSACPVAELARSMRWLAGQNAGQCGPCVHGLAAIAASVDGLAEGRADERTVARLRRWSAQLERRGACHHPDGAVRFLGTGLRVFADEVEDHRRHGPCDACDRAPVLSTISLREVAA